MMLCGTTLIFVNTRYQAVVNAMCDDLLPSLAIMFEAFVAFGVTMFVAEIIRRKLGSIGKEASQESGGPKSSQVGIHPGHKAQPVEFQGGVAPPTQLIRQTAFLEPIQGYIEVVTQPPSYEDIEFKQEKDSS